MQRLDRPRSGSATRPGEEIAVSDTSRLTVDEISRHYIDGGRPLSHPRRVWLILKARDCERKAGGSVWEGKGVCVGRRGNVGGRLVGECGEQCVCRGNSRKIKYKCGEERKAVRREV